MSDKGMSPEDQAIYWMNEGRKETIKEFRNRIIFLEGRILELENKIVDLMEGK